MSRPSSHPRSEVGKRLAELRQSKGLTQKQLAEAVGTAFQNIAYWERSATAPRGDVLPKLANILHVSVDELLGVKKSTAIAKPPRGRLHKIVNDISLLPRRQQQRIIGVVEDLLSAQHSNGHAKAA